MCNALGYSRASLHRSLTKQTDACEKPKKKIERRSHRRLSDAEENKIQEVLNSPRFRDIAPAEAYTTLLDEGIYFCSIRTMYRILAKHGETTQRRQSNVRTYARPELLATRPNELWSWDITKLKGPARWQYFHLYKIMDVFSRYIVGWMVAEKESDDLARELIAETILKQEIVPETLTLHADRGASMKSITVGQMLMDLGVAKTHSRPHVSNDNPYSESAFKTLKYRPDFPDTFGALPDARNHCKDFVSWYNTEHHHSGIAMLTPEQVHYKSTRAVLDKRSIILAEAFMNYPERFVNGMPKIEEPATAVWINKPVPIENDNKQVCLNSK